MKIPETFSPDSLVESEGELVRVKEAPEDWRPIETQGIYGAVWNGEVLATWNYPPTTREVEEALGRDHRIILLEET